MSQTTHAPAHEAPKPAANGKAKPRDKAHDAQMALALLLTQPQRAQKVGAEADREAEGAT